MGVNDDAHLYIEIYKCVIFFVLFGVVLEKNPNYDVTLQGLLSQHICSIKFFRLRVLRMVMECVLFDYQSRARSGLG